MIGSMLEDYKQVHRLHHPSYFFLTENRLKSGWLPMWKNIVETNIMVRPILFEYSI